jgi:hypothetical protein
VTKIGYLKGKLFFKYARVLGEINSAMGMKMELLQMHSVKNMKLLELTEVKIFYFTQKVAFGYLYYLKLKKLSIFT